MPEMEDGTERCSVAPSVNGGATDGGGGDHIEPEGGPLPGPRLPLSQATDWPFCRVLAEAGPRKFSEQRDLVAVPWGETIGGVPTSSDRTVVTLQMTNLGTLGEMWSFGETINDRGQVTRYSIVASGGNYHSVMSCPTR